MADGPDRPGPRLAGPARPAGPLSPHLTIYAWPLTMAASITHRMTGVALGAGTLLIAWWLVAAASGPAAYEVFLAVGAHAAGQAVLFLFVWALAFHLLNGLRHLAWDFGFGFKVSTARLTAAVVYVFSVLIAAGVFALTHFSGTFENGGAG